MDTAARFWDRIAARYAAKAVPDEDVYAHKLALTADRLEPHHEVLEIGCGTGTTALHHAHRVRQIRAIDVSPKMIEIARGKAQAAGVENVHFEVGTVAGQLGASSSVDVIMAHSILHLLDDWRGALGQLHDTLRPGGLLVASIPCIGDTAAWFGLVGPLGHALGLLPLVRVFTKAELLEAIGEAGLEIEVQWAPERTSKSQGVFIVARRPEGAGAQVPADAVR